MKTRFVPLCALIGLAGMAIDAPAGQIFVNSPLVSIDSVTGTVGDAKFRLSNTNFDLSIDNAPSTFTPADQVTLNLGNVNHLSGKVFDFVLEHRAGQGFIFSVDGPGSLDGTVSWGTFAVAPPGPNQAALNGKLPTQAYNSLLIEARATMANSSFGVSDLSFSGAGLSIVDGGFLSGMVTPTTGNPLGFSSQRVFADANLAGFDWTLTGSIVGNKPMPTGDEMVRFNVAFQQVDASVVPEPSTAILAGMGLLPLGVVALRRRRARRRG